MALIFFGNMGSSKSRKIKYRKTVKASPNIPVNAESSPDKIPAKLKSLA
jgi:hypothetical protein